MPVSATAPRRYPDFPTRRARGRVRPAAAAATGEAKKPLSILEIGVNLLGHGLDRLVPGEFLAIDEKGRRGIDPELLGSVIAHLLDAVQHLLIRQTFVEGLLREAELLGDLAQRLDR